MNKITHIYLDFFQFEPHFLESLSQDFWVRISMLESIGGLGLFFLLVGHSSAGVAVSQAWYPLVDEMLERRHLEEMQGQGLQISVVVEIYATS